VTVFHNPTPEQILSADLVKGTQKSIQKGTQKSIQKTLELIKQNGSSTILELARETGLSEPGIKKHLRKLQEQGLLKRVGPDKGGHWEVIDNKDANE